MNFSNMMANEQIKKRIDEIANFVPDPYLSVFDFERQVFFQDDIWSYTSGFHFKRDELPSAGGILSYFYGAKGNVGISIRFHDEELILNAEEEKRIRNSLSTYTRYVERVDNHKRFIQALNLIFVESWPPSWAPWELNRDNGTDKSFFTQMRVKDESFDVLVETTISDGKVMIEYVQLSQCEEGNYDNSFELISVLTEEKPELLKQWLNELLGFYNEYSQKGESDQWSKS